MTEYFKVNYGAVNNENIIMKSTDKLVFKDMATNIITTIQEYFLIGPIGYKNNFDIIGYWNSLKDCPLKLFALNIVTIPGSNCSIERLFSFSSIIEDKKRLKLTSEKKSMLVCLQSWIKSDFI